MALKMSTALANKMLDCAFNSAAGISFDNGTLKVLGGTRATDADTAIGAQPVLSTVTTPADSFAAASGRSVAKAGTWQDLSADATGTATWFRYTDASGVYVVDGDCGVGTGDLQLDSVSFTVAQQFTITAFAPNL